MSGFEESGRRGDDDRVRLGDVLATIWAYRWVVLAATILGGAIGFAVVLLTPDTYEARSTVFVAAPPFSNELSPQALSMEAYERLAQSGYIRDLVARELDPNASGATEAIVGNMSTRLYPSEEAARPFLPVLDLIVRAPNAELTQKVANAWATVFAREQSRLAVLDKSRSIDFVLDEFAKASARVLDDRRKLTTEQTALDREYAQVAGGAAVESKRQRSDSLDRLVARAEAELFEIQVDVRQGQERLKKLEAELATLKPVIVLNKPVDESRSGAKGTSPTGQAVPTEESNPVYLALAQQLSEDRVMVAALAARERMLSEQLPQLRKQAASARADFLEADRRMLALERDHELRLAPHTQAVEAARAGFGKLEQKIGDAQIAKAVSAPTVSVAAAATLPASPVEVAAWTYVAGAAGLAFAGALLALALLHYAGLLHSSAGASAGRPSAPAVSA